MSNCSREAKHFLFVRMQMNWKRLSVFVGLASGCSMNSHIVVGVVFVQLQLDVSNTS